MSYLNKLLVR